MSQIEVTQQRRSMKRTLFLFISVMSIAFTLPLVVNGQRQMWYRGNLQDTIKRLEDDADRFQGSLDTDLDHSPMNGTSLASLRSTYHGSLRPRRRLRSARYHSATSPVSGARSANARGSGRATPLISTLP